ncbi:hypothetical protein KVR01_009136 [Diaporthe batatas]|uniref:uncharacterized protein n=1 Tax=Diaporthe batatas TaxID=748121 RepID=UPI001D038B5D|nr:uncharacterized protein KVR01_009136 [Diaporthe batatas]KAG8160872.1 hypothetical protein KVR01_009136 [Diaporthe batatas]
MAQKLKQGTKVTTVLRKFGINESYQLAMYLLDQYRGTVLSCRYAIPRHLTPSESRPQLAKAVELAVIDTVMRHPMLRVGMAEATSKTPSWVQLESLDLKQHINWIYVEGNENFDKCVQEIFAAKLDERFPDLCIKQPGWWITILRQGDAPVMELLLTWNLTQFDAVGAKVFHEDLVEMLNAEHGACERTKPNGDILKLPQAAPVLPDPIEGLTSLPVGLRYLARSIWDEIRPPFLSRDASQAGWCPIRTTPYKTQYRAFFIEEASLVAVLKLCRKNKTTVTALIHGLALIAFSSHLNSNAAPAFQSSTIVDHRRNLPPAPRGVPWVSYDRAVANYVTSAVHKYDRSLVKRVRSKLRADTSEKKKMSPSLQRELWAVSSRSRQEIVSRLDKGVRNDPVGVFKYVTDWQQTMRDQASKTRQFSWLITNIGVVEGRGSKGSSTKSEKPDEATNGGPGPKGDGEKWLIERAQFGLSAEVPAAAIEFSPVSAAGGGMSVGANWPDCAVDSKLGERIMADMERWLNELASQS